MNIASWLDRTARAEGARDALFAGAVPVMDYAGFHEAAQAVAGWLIARGVAPGDRVAIFAANIPEYLVAQYGAWYAGAAIVPINAKLHAAEVTWICQNAGAKLVFTTEAEALTEAGCPGEIIGLADAAWRAALGHAGAGPLDRGADDLAWLFYTSGTTGRPKGVCITHRMLEVMSLGYLADVDMISRDDAALYAAPLSHGAGIYNMMHVLKGARHVFPPSGGFDPVEIFDLARKLGRVHMFAAPTMVKRLTRIAKERGESGEGLRTIVYAGGPMYLADIIEAVDHFGPIFAQVYGQGECPMGITVLTREEVADRSHPRWRERLASVGRAQSASEVAILDGDGALLPPGEHGEIAVRGDIVMPGYWQNDAATQKTIRDGWLWTGDMGWMDAEGFVTMQDRSKDLIISGGSNIYPREVEEALLTHPDVAEVSVVGRPHEEWGEEVVAFVVTEADRPLDTAALDAHCLERIARFKRPKDYLPIDALPKNNYGKVLKTELRDRLKR